MTNLADCFEGGRGRPQSREKSAFWYGRAAEKGLLLARLIVAERRMLDGPPLGPDELSKLIQDASVSTDTDAINRLAGAYERGVLVPKNLNEALKFYRVCADGGRRDCMYAVARFYTNAIGVDRDDAEAAKWFKKAADLGDAGAMNELGISFERGRGVDLNMEQAVAYYTKAAARDNVAAMENSDASLSSASSVGKTLFWHDVGSNERPPRGTNRQCSASRTSNCRRRMPSRRANGWRRPRRSATRSLKAGSPRSPSRSCLRLASLPRR